MPRPHKKRFCRRYRENRVYKPQGIPMRTIDEVEIPLDQFEAMRLVDHQGYDQSEAGDIMGISRGTIQRLLHAGRSQLIDAILTNSAIIIKLEESEK